METQNTYPDATTQVTADAYISANAPPAAEELQGSVVNGEYAPPAPATLEDAGLHPNDLYPLVLKFLSVSYTHLTLPTIYSV